MTLKQLRISKGLNQAECARFLGMTTRNYQNYENDVKKTKTAKYNAIYKRLEAYMSAVSTMVVAGEEFHTNVVTGMGLQALSKRVTKYKKRDCYKKLKRFVSADFDGKICILYGLRRTGAKSIIRM